MPFDRHHVAQKRVERLLVIDQALAEEPGFQSKRTLPTSKMTAATPATWFSPGEP
jgi:hypothetical protein